MSLQSRIVALFSASMLVAIALGAAVAGLQARITLRAEIQAALTGGLQTVRRAYEDLPRSDHQPRDLVQLVATFDANRHLSATLVGLDGRVLAASRPDAGRVTAPRWFDGLIAPSFPQLRLAAPGAAQGREAILLRAVPAADVGALWAEISGVVVVLACATVVGLALVLLMVRLALSPLRELSRGLAEVGQGRAPRRLRERGPTEVLALERSFNAMAGQLAEVSRRNAALEQQLLTLQDEERAEIARDLHDEVGPQLFAVSLDAQLINQLLASGRPEAVRAQVEAIQAGVGHIQREVRTLVARLRPVRATELGLGRAMEDLVRFWSVRRPEIAFHVVLPSSEADLADGTKDTAFRVVQEAVSNAVRHARPTRIDIGLVRTPTTLDVRVANDGVEQRGPEPASGFGLTGMRERVRTVGGRLEIRPPAPGGGVWEVLASLSQAVRRPASAPLPDAPA
jgi:two-component system, NarL family, sensor histidine kinase UhpB